MSEPEITSDIITMRTSREIKRQASKIIRKLRTANLKVAQFTRMYKASQRKPTRNYLDVNRHNLIRWKLSKARRRRAALWEMATHPGWVDALLLQFFRDNSGMHGTAINNPNIILTLTTNPNMNDAIENRPDVDRNLTTTITNNSSQTDAATVGGILAHSFTSTTMNEDTTNYWCLHTPSHGEGLIFETVPVSYDIPINDLDDAPEAESNGTREASHETSFYYNSNEETWLIGTPSYNSNEETPLSASVVDLSSQQHASAIVQAMSRFDESEAILDYVSNIYVNLSYTIFTCELAHSENMMHASSLESEYVIHGG
jgi:hypothetical protein